MNLTTSFPRDDDEIHAYMRPYPERVGEWMVMFRPSIKAASGYCPFFAVAETVGRRAVPKGFSEADARTAVKRLEGEMRSKEGSYEVV